MINSKTAKAIRQVLRKALKIDKIQAEYRTQVTKSKDVKVEQDASSIRKDENSEPDAGNGTRIFRVQSLAARLDPRCSRSLYKRTKHLHAASKSPLRGAQVDAGGATEELWAPTGGFLPDSRIMDITPKQEAESPDHAGGSSPSHDLPEDVQGNE